MPLPMLLDGKLPLSFNKRHLSGQAKKVPSQAQQQRTIEIRAIKKGIAKRRSEREAKKKDILQARERKEMKETKAYKKEKLELLRGIKSKL